MKLRTLRLSGDWKLQQPLALQDQNLLVGVNASGKSTIISRIELLGRLVSGDMKPSDLPAKQTVGFVAEFESDKTKLVYELEITNSRVVHERFLNGVDPFLIRDQRGEGTIHYAQTGQMMEFQSPVTALAVVSRQDSRQHPFLEPLTRWGRDIYGAYVGVGLMHREVMVVGPTPANTTLDDGSLRPSSGILELLQRGLLSKYREDFKTHIIEDMAILSYFLEDIDFRIAPELTGRFPGLGSVLASFGSQPSFQAVGTPILAFIKERGIDTNVDQFQISEGMWRALAIIIYLNFMRFSSKPSCMLIDDIGEGLDFDRSCKLIELVQQRTRADGTQLIMSTNDRFVMNAVPIENWTVLRRNGAVVNAYNYANSREIFEEFKDTGLNNFDFLRMDFLNPAREEDSLE